MLSICGLEVAFRLRVTVVAGCLDLDDSVAFALGSSRIKASPSL